MGSVVFVVLGLAICLAIACYYSESVLETCVGLCRTGVRQVDLCRDIISSSVDSTYGNGSTLNFYTRVVDQAFAPSEADGSPRLTPEEKLAMIVLLSIMDSEYTINDGTGVMSQGSSVIRGLVRDVFTKSCPHSCSDEAKTTMTAIIATRRWAADGTDETRSTTSPDTSRIRNTVAQRFVTLYKDEKFHNKSNSRSDDSHDLDHLFTLVFMTGASYKPSNRKFDKTGLRECALLFASVVRMFSAISESDTEDGGVQDYMKMGFTIREFRKTAAGLDVRNRCLDQITDILDEKIRRRALLPTHSLCNSTVSVEDW